MSGFYLFVLWLSDEKVSVLVIPCSLLQEDADCESVFVCIRTNKELEKQLKNMCKNQYP